MQPILAITRALLSFSRICDEFILVLQPLCMDNYVEKFSVLLHLEELQQEIDLLEFSLDRVSMTDF